jgi:RNA polymerase sigma-70 factor (ECF subfamily)
MAIDANAQSSVISGATSRERRAPQVATNANDEANPNEGSSLSDQEIQDLVTQAQKGDASAFYPLYAHFNKPLYRYFYNLGFTQEEIADLSHDTLLKAFTAIGSYRGDAKFKTWIFSIAHNVAADVFRMKRKQAETLDISELVHPKLALPGHEDHVIEKLSMVEPLVMAIHRLRGSQKKVIQLQLADYSWQEIAQQLGLSVDAVEKRYQRACKKLLKEMSRIDPTYRSDLFGGEGNVDS